MLFPSSTRHRAAVKVNGNSSSALADIRPTHLALSQMNVDK